MQRRIQSLDSSLSSFVRASKCIGSFRTAVEEVILNSIDANCRSISIYIDFLSCSFEIYDDGNGIDANCLEAKVAEWNRTSKQNNALLDIPSVEHAEDSTYGMKGEALAALRQLSNVCILSRAKNGIGAREDRVYKKNMHYNSPAEFHSMDAHDNASLGKRWSSTYSTGVLIRNLFHNLPVRRKAMKPDVERNLFKEFIQHMSVLHHNISWNLFECILDPSLLLEPQYTVLLRLPSQVSVAKRFLHIHGVENMINMQEISKTSHEFILQGFMTPPVSEYCTKHREGQYLYLNSRWLRGNDCFSRAINSIYSRVITAASGGNLGGMVARHASYSNLSTVGGNTSSSADRGGSKDSDTGLSNNSSSNAAVKQINTYPYFVLHLTCPTSEYDILSEPDKSVVVFRNEVHALQCIEEVCSALVRQHYSDRVDTLLPLVPVNPFVRASMVSARTSATATVLDLPGSDTDPDTTEGDALHYTSEPALYSISNNVYTIATGNSNTDAQYITSPFTMKTSATYTSDTNSPYFASKNQPTNNYRIYPDRYPNYAPTLVPTTTSMNSSISTHKNSNNIYPSQGDLFQSAFFNGNSPTHNTLSPAQNLSASNLFQDSPYAAKPSTDTTTSVASIPITTTVTSTLPYYDSPYQVNSSIATATHLQYSGVKRMVTSITEPTMHKSSNKTKHSWHASRSSETIYDHNDSSLTKKLKYSLVNGSSSFYAVFGDSGSDLIHTNTSPQRNIYNTAVDIPYMTSTYDGYSAAGNDNTNDNRSVVYDSPYRSYDDNNVCSVDNIMVDIACADEETDPVDADETSFIDTVDHDGSAGAMCSSSDGNTLEREDAIDYYGDDTHVYNSPGTLDPNIDSAAYVTSRLATPGYVQHSLQDTANSNTNDLITIDDTNLSTLVALQQAAHATLPILPVRICHTEIALNKTTLQQHLRCIDQCDKRYIVATSCICDHDNDDSVHINDNRTDGRQSSATRARSCTKCNNTSLLLLLDQHAVDERIQVEALTQAVSQAHTINLANTTNSMYYTTSSSTESITLSNRELSIVQTKHQVLLDWGFCYTLHSPSTSEQGGVTSTTTLQLHTVPCIAGEPLHASDLVEFIHYISIHSELPSSLLVPPAVHRIVSSRACHSAVRFGDALSTEKCALLCQQLMNTELPFQCAHGRPSMAPLLDLRGLQQYKREELKSAYTVRVWNL